MFRRQITFQRLFIPFSKHSYKIQKEIYPKNDKLNRLFRSMTHVFTKFVSIWHVLRRKFFFSVEKWQKKKQCLKIIKITMSNQRKNVESNIKSYRAHRRVCWTWLVTSQQSTEDRSSSQVRFNRSTVLFSCKCNTYATTNGSSSSSTDTNNDGKMCVVVFERLV